MMNEKEKTWADQAQDILESYEKWHTAEMQKAVQQDIGDS